MDLEQSENFKTGFSTSLLCRLSLRLLLYCVTLMILLGLPVVTKSSVVATTTEIKESTDSRESSEFKSYFYSFWGDDIACPPPYLIETVLTGEDLGCGNFSNPTDIFADASGNIFITDNYNNRIIKLNNQLELINIFDGTEESNGTKSLFNNPSGIFVTDSGDIYIADTDNARIVKMDATGKLIKIIGQPESELLPDNFAYKPLKLVVDDNGRIHAIAANVNQGIIEFNTAGEFEGFLAAGKVNPNPLLMLLKLFSTKAQKDLMPSFVPIEYNNITLDNEGFIYATCAAIDPSIVIAEIISGKGTEKGALVRRLNMLGKDILKRNGFFPPVGDIELESNTLAGYQGISQIMDVACSTNGVYSILDNNRKRIFTYDGEGEMLYAFGGPGVESGGFNTPFSIVYSGDRLLILDKNEGTLTVYGITSYGKNISDAIALYDSGKYDEAALKWDQALKQNANYELAYTGLGKSAYRKAEYSLAMKYFKLGNNRLWYSKAFKEYRKGIIAIWFAPVAIFLIIAFAVLFSLSVIKKYKKNEEACR